MIFYFTGTGNSRYLAEKLAAALHEELCSINERIKTHDNAAVQTAARVIIVTPTYAWRIPRIVRDWLLKTELIGAKQAWFVMDCGGAIGNAGKYNRTLCRQKKLRYMGTAQIIMPENYIALFDAPGTKEAREIVRKAEPDLEQVIQRIKAGKAFVEQPDTLPNKLESGPVNPLFYALIVKAKAFYAKDSCIGCGTCKSVCPLNNVHMKQGRPVWGRNCTHCMACISYCPTEAIEYGKKSAGKPRYSFEKLKKLQ